MSVTVTPNVIENLIMSYPRDISILIAGQPGIGKSELLAQIAKKLGAKIVRYEMATMDAVDVKGCPFPIGKATEFLPPKDFLDLTDQAEYTGPMVANFDDLGAADEAVFNALLGIMLQREVGQYKIRDNVILAATTNRAEDKAGARQITTALNNRFAHFTMECDAKQWVAWAQNNDIEPDIIAYIRACESELNTFDPKSGEYAFATPRSVAMASRVQKAIGLNNGNLVTALASCCGYAWAGQYKAWLDRTRTLVTPEEILKDPKNCRVPESHEIDVIHATIANLAHHIQKNNSFKTLKAGYIYAARLHAADIAAVLAADLNRLYTTGGDAETLAKGASDPDFMKVFKMYQELEK